MISDPAQSIKTVRDLPYPYGIPLKATPDQKQPDAAGGGAGGSALSGYDGPGECLKHVYNRALSPGKAIPTNWIVFDQNEFTHGGLSGVGFHSQGFVYIPSQCRLEAGSTAKPWPCKLILRPDKCTPKEGSMAPDVGVFADYAEANDLVVLHPCTGGAVNTTKFPNAPDIVAGKLDLYGQLDANYVMQSAPHMAVVARMVRRLLGLVEPPLQGETLMGALMGAEAARETPSAGTGTGTGTGNGTVVSVNAKAFGDADCAKGSAISNVGAICGTCNPQPPDGSGLYYAFACEGDYNKTGPIARLGCEQGCGKCAGEMKLPFGKCVQVGDGYFIKASSCTPSSPIQTLPTLKIDKSSVMTAGCSNTADFSSQFHVAFSSIVTGSCIFSGMPFHCAVTRFPKDYMVPKALSTAAGMDCMPGCDDNGTLIYDHCKNHPLWVNLPQLWEYAEEAGPGYVDDPRQPDTTLIESINIVNDIIVRRRSEAT